MFCDPTQKERRSGMTKVLFLKHVIGVPRRCLRFFVMYMCLPLVILSVCIILIV